MAERGVGLDLHATRPAFSKFRHQFNTTPTSRFISYKSKRTERSQTFCAVEDCVALTFQDN